jgi:hypothetical protein
MCGSQGYRLAFDDLGQVWLETISGHDIDPGPEEVSEGGFEGSDSERLGGRSKSARRSTSEQVPSAAFRSSGSGLDHE